MAVKERNFLYISCAVLLRVPAQKVEAICCRIATFFTFHFGSSYMVSKTYIVCRLGDSGFFRLPRYQGIVKATVSGVFEVLK